MWQPNQLGQRDLAGERIMREVEKPEATEIGYSYGEYSGEAVVGEVEVLEVWPRGEIQSRRRRKKVVVKAEVSEMSESSRWLSRAEEIEAIKD